jgi:hypothetical protein
MGRSSGLSSVVCPGGGLCHSIQGETPRNPVAHRRVVPTSSCDSSQETHFTIFYLSACCAPVHFVLFVPLVLVSFMISPPPQREGCSQVNRVRARPSLAQPPDRRGNKKSLLLRSFRFCECPFRRGPRFPLIHFFHFVLDLIRHYGIIRCVIYGRIRREGAEKEHPLPRRRPLVVGWNGQPAQRANFVLVRLLARAGRRPADRNREGQTVAVARLLCQRRSLPSAGPVLRRMIGRVARPSQARKSRLIVPNRVLRQ